MAKSKQAKQSKHKQKKAVQRTVERRKERIRSRAIARREKKAKEMGKESLTSNAKMIVGVMDSDGVSGNYKDYVLLTGDRLIDWKRSHAIRTPDGKSIGVDGIALVHKKKLANMLPAEIADQFWHPKMGRAGARQ
jgi:hypothetical protein